MKRDQLAMRLEARWRELHAAFQGLSHDALLEPGVVGPWSIRDVLAHVATWEEEAMKALPVILDNGPLPRYSTFYGGIDAFNAQAQEWKATLTLEQVFQALEDTHDRLLSYLEGVPDVAFARESRFLRRLRQDTYGHYREHTQQIQAWRQTRRP